MILQTFLKTFTQIQSVQFLLRAGYRLILKIYWNNILEIFHKKETAAEKQYRINNDPNGVQGAVRIARPFLNRHQPDFKKAMSLNSLFGGFFGSRLMSNIREDKGYTYGIHSFLENHIRESAWVISTEAAK